MPTTGGIRFRTTAVTVGKGAKMNRRSTVVLVLLVSITPIWTDAQEGNGPPPLAASHLGDDFLRFRCFGMADAFAFIGEEGTLLVDTGFGVTAPALLDELTALEAPPIRIIVNTHRDLDHIGGNEVLANDLVIATPDVRESMRSYYSLPPLDALGQPTLTIGGESTIYFEGETIRLMPIPGGHTPGDLVVHFTEKNVAFIGDLVLTGTFPNADPEKGGNARRLAEVLKTLRAEFKTGTMIVPSHGGEITMTELDAYIEMIEETTAAVASEIEAGLPLAAIVEKNPLAPWAEWEHPETGLTFERWITEIHSSLTGASTSSICAPVSEALESDGIDAAIARYRQLAAGEPELWRFDRRELNTLGYQLLGRERFADAISILTLNTEIFPEHFDPWDSLGEAYMRAGMAEPAVANYRHSLELNPDNTNAVTMLARINGE